MKGPILVQSPSLYSSFQFQYLPQNPKQLIKYPPKAPHIFCDQQTEQYYIEQLIDYILKEVKQFQLPGILSQYPFSYSLSQKRQIKFIVQLIRGLEQARYLESTPFAENQKTVILSPTQKKFTLVLDLDETLLHTQPYKYSSMCQNVQINGISMYYMYRPYLKNFLEEMSQHFEIIIFTASSQEYAQLFCSCLPGISYILSREHTRKHSSGYLIKDLNILKQQRKLKNIIIMDNLISCFAHNLNNGIPCVEFKGESDDKELLTLAGFLKEIAQYSIKNGCSIKHSLKKKSFWISQEIPSLWKQLMMLP